VSSSEHDFQDVPRSRDGAPNWAADTDPVGPVTPELALVDPALASGGEFNSEVTMSSMQFGDGTAAAPAASAEAQPIAPLQPIPPLNQVTPPAEVAAPVPAEDAPAVPVTDMRDVPLGTLVFRAGLLPEERLEEALHEGMKTGRRLGEILLERGWVSENDLGRLLAGQKGLPFVELDPAAIDPTAPPLLHPEKARLHGALPVGFQDGVPVVAVADPSNDLVVENVRRALACEPVLVVAGRDALARTIEQAYSGGVETPAPEAAPAPEVAPTPVVEASEQAAEAVTPAPEPVAPVAEPVAAAPEAVPAVEPEAPAAETPAPEPVAPLVVEPVAAEQPVAPLAGELVTAEPVEPTPVEQIEPVAAQPETEAAQNGQGVWIGETVAETPAEAAPEPVQEVEPVEAAPVAEPEPPAEVVAAEAEPEADPESGLAWTVTLRLSDGERIEVGSFASEAEAVEGAHHVVAQLTADAGWPFFAGRFLRPDTIVSVDLAQDDADRWLGSSARAAAWTQKPAG
jgi:Type II secretion system (T2SS), protein E, N-terminal domain